MREAEKLAKNVPTGTAAGRKAQKGNSTPKVKTKRPVGRFFKAEIRLTKEDYSRGLLYFENEKSLAGFVLDAYREKINRAESNDKAFRYRTLMTNMELLESVLKEMHTRGKLNFLSVQKTDVSGNTNKEGA
jgi:hypothetical protein